MLSSVNLILVFTGLSLSQTDICSLSQESVANLKTVFSIGNRIYLGNDLQFYGLSVEPQVQAKPNQSIGQLFTGIEFEDVLTTIHFRGPLPCRKQNSSCTHLADHLVLVINRDTSPQWFQAFRYSPTTGTLTAIVDSSQMPWGLKTREDTRQLWPKLNIETSDFPDQLTSATYYHSKSSLIFTIKTEDKTLFLSKPLLANGSFSTQTFFKFFGPNVDSIFVDSKGRLFGFTNDGSSFIQIGISETSVDAIGNKIPALIFFDCLKSSPLESLKPVDDSIVSEPAINAALFGAETDICGAGEQPSNISAIAFSIGRNIYFGNQSIVYPFNIESDRSEYRQTVKDLFPGLVMRTIQSVVHFRGPPACALCSHLVIVFNGSDVEISRYESFRFHPSNLSLTRIANNSMMPWGLNFVGLVSQLFKAWNVEGDPPRTVTSAAYNHMTATLYLTTRTDSGQGTTYLYKKVESDGTFKQSPLTAITGPEVVDSVTTDSSGKMIGFTRAGLTFAQMVAVSDTTLNLMGEQIPVLKFFNCPEDVESSWSAFLIIILVIVIVVMILATLFIVYLFCTRKSRRRKAVDNSNIKVASDRYTLASVK